MPREAQVPVRITTGRMPTTVGLAITLLVAGCSGGGDEAREPAPPVPAPPTATLPAVKLPKDTPALGQVIPAPVRVQPDKRQNFRLSPDTTIQVLPAETPSATKGARRAASYLAGVLKPATGFDLPVSDGDAGDAAPPAITLRLAKGDKVHPEAYRLEVDRRGVTVTAANSAGLFNGVHTLRQLLPDDIERGQPVRRDWAVAGGLIEDRPRFGYRGTMLDVARHFFGVPEVKRHIDRIAQFKINHLHLHLSDDQGWRIEIKSWPKLTEIGGRTQVGGGQGGYYTQAQYRAIVAYAASRGVTIVPEIDMPGHTNAALTAYPELNCSGRSPAPATGYATGFSSLCVGKDVTYQFARDVIGELSAMTPAPYLHIGGDEAQSTSAADYRRFFSRVLPMVEERGKRALGWHEYAKTDLPRSAVVQYWRIETAEAATAKAAAAGRQVLMSPANKTYLDMKYFESDARGNKWAGPVSVRTSYDWNPARFLSGVSEGQVLGVETPLWTELVETEDDIERMAFPRIPAIAEVGWTDQARRAWPDFTRRLGQYGSRMTAQGIGFHHSPEVAW